MIPRLAGLYDEPFGDSSAIPTFLVARLARQQVTVALSGDGGDELFCGYRRYQRTNDIWSLMRFLPSAARRAMSRGVGALSRRSRSTATAGKGSSPGALPARADGGGYLPSPDRATPRTRSELVMDDGGGRYRERPRRSRATTCIPTMMLQDTLTYLPDDILVKVDRASMAVGLEARVPMLDHRVLEFAWHLPMRLKVRGQTGKWLLRQVLRKYLPDSADQGAQDGIWRARERMGSWAAARVGG